MFGSKHTGQSDVNEKMRSVCFLGTAHAMSGLGIAWQLRRKNAWLTLRVAARENHGRLVRDGSLIDRNEHRMVDAYYQHTRCQAWRM